MRHISWLAIVLFTFITPALKAQFPLEPFWKVTDTRTQASFRGLHALDRFHAWACGSRGTVVRTIDGGESWTTHPIPGLGDMELRSLHAWSAEKVVVATAGTPCRIYRTEDAGKQWEQVYENTHPNAFIDGMQFWSSDEGILFGDPLDGKLMTLATRDGGKTWTTTSAMPLSMLEGEAGFAASNSSLLVFQGRDAWIGLGGATGSSSVLMSRDKGNAWTRSNVSPIPSGKSSGIFSLARSTEDKVIAVGGDYLKPESDEGNIAILDPETTTWRAPRGNRPRGYRSSVIYCNAPVELGRSDANHVLITLQWLTVGPTGCDGSSDGEVWFPISDEPFHALSAAPDGSLWASGANGRIAVHGQD